MSKLAIVVLLFALAAAISLTEAQNIPSCATQLVPCANYLNATTEPPNTCCNPIKQAVATQLDCLCNLCKDPNLLKSFGINVADALRMTRLCGVTVDFTACNKASTDSPTASVPPPPSTYLLDLHVFSPIFSPAILCATTAFTILFLLIVTSI